jgi:DNA-binding beta-propeller fold protein YncE
VVRDIKAPRAGRLAGGRTGLRSIASWAAVTALLVAGSGGAQAATPVRGAAGDGWADVVLGQPDFGQITPNEVTARRLFNPGGVLVDRSVRPARVYVYDGGNSRVLGLSHLGHVANDPSTGCTSPSDAPGSSCVIEQGRGADIVLGQPDFTHSGCNGDGNFQTYPVRAPASATTLCTMPVDQVSPLEGGSFGGMAVDPANGDVYVPDFDNHRVLLYRSPFTTDTVADDVWGHADFAGNACNRGRGVGAPDADSLCFRSPSNDGFVAGVGLDSDGNLWVTDNENNRVLRFPHDGATGRPAHVADLVLGQPDFASSGRGSALGEMSGPAAVRVAANGTVYVADSLNGRILVFAPPLSSGMTATGTLGSGFRIPTGLEFDPGTGGLWVSDRLNNQLLLFVNGQVSKVLLKDVQDNGGTCGTFNGDGAYFFSEGDHVFISSSYMCDPAGSIGVDADGDVLVSGSSFFQDVWRFPAPLPDPTPGLAHSADARLLPPFQSKVHNEVGLSGIYSARGIAVARDQVIAADSGRLLFWNDADDVRSGQPADGFVGASDPRLQPQPPFGRIRNDGRGRLWAIRGGQVFVYALPLTTGATLVGAITSPVPVLGGGVITWNDFLAIGGIAPNRRGTLLWVADPRHNRVFRIRDPLTHPVVDIVLGQKDTTGTGCNYGRDEDSPKVLPVAQSRDSLCEPGAVVLDHHGNVWVSDNALEVQGNRRLLEYDASLFRGRRATARFAPPATRVFGTGGSFTSPGCQDALCGPWEPAFSSRGQMVVGLNGIFGQRFPIFYNDPLRSATPSGALNDFGSMPYAATFDRDDNLYVTDLNRDRVFVYRRPFARK